MAHDPFNTPADRLRGVLKYWMWYLAIAAVLIVLTERNLIARENKDHLVSGEVERIDTSGLSDDQRFALSDKLRKAFGGFEISGLWDRAMAALSFGSTSSP